MKTKKQHLQSIKREFKLALYNANLNIAEHDRLHPDRPGRGHEFKRYQETWRNFLYFSNQARLLKEKYKDIKKSYKPIYF